MSIKKIDKTTDNGAFEIAFRDGGWNLNTEQVLPLFQALIKRHNELVELVNKLPISGVVQQSEQLFCYHKGSYTLNEDGTCCKCHRPLEPKVK